MFHESVQVCLFKLFIYIVNFRDMCEPLRFALFTHKLSQISLLSNFLRIDEYRLMCRVLHFAKLLCLKLFVDDQLVVRIEVNKHFVLDSKSVCNIIFQLSIKSSIAIKSIHFLNN